LVIIVVAFLILLRGGFESENIQSSPLKAAPRLIHGPRLSCVTQGSVTVSWETDVRATSTVRYGPTPTYGLVVTDTARVGFHSVVLTGLAVSTDYHYQVSSTSDGGTTSSPDHRFSTVVTDTQPFSFFSLGDGRAWSEHEPLPAAFAAIVRRIRSLRPNLILFVGDAVYGSADSARLRSQWDEWKETTDPLACTVPLYLAFASHEGNDLSGVLDGAVIFRDELVQPTNGPAGLLELAYSFDYGNCHFVCLDSDLRDDPARIDSAQRLWLKHDLATTRKLHKFVFAHRPAFPPRNLAHGSLEDHPADRDSFWSLLQTYHVDAYICGYVHLWNRDFFVHSGQGNAPADTAAVKQVTNGTCGAPVTTGYDGEFYHFVQWRVDGETVKAAVIDDYGAVRDSFQYRKTPLTVQLTPDTLSIMRTAVFTYYVDFENTIGDSQKYSFWADLYLPNGRAYQGNPVYGSTRREAAPYDSGTLAVMHRVPANTPPGIYRYVGKVGSPPSDVVAADTLWIRVLGDTPATRRDTSGTELLHWRQGRSVEFAEGG
jgi:hypothetical protein